MRRFFVLLVLVIFCFSCFGAAKDHGESARAFAVEQLKNPATFSPSPPSDINPYKNMSPKEITQKQMKAFSNGSVLLFHMNGLPSAFMSNSNHKKHGPEKGWYEDGRVKYEEQYKQGQLVDGKYFDRSGKQLGKVKNGTGVKVIYAKPHERANSMLGFCEYKNGVKHGVETIHRDYAKKIKSSERHYKEGKLHGASTIWMRSGVKNEEEHYKDGVKDGNTTNYYKSGKRRYILKYVNGKQTDSTHYYETGKKSKEVSGKEVKRWFKSGQLMVRKVTGENMTVASGESFDMLGNQNGKVVNGEGILIEADSSYDGSRDAFYQLSAYKNKERTRYGSIFLPTVKRSGMNYSDTKPTAEMDIIFKSSQLATWQGGTVKILLPKGCSSKSSLELKIDKMDAGKSVEPGKIKISLPEPYRKWTGEILADVNGTIREKRGVQGVFVEHKVRYQNVIVNHKAEKEVETRRPSNRRRRFSARQTSGKYLKTSKDMPHNLGQTVPKDGKIADHWTVRKADGDRQEWALYKSPAMLLMKGGNDKEWKVVRKKFGYRPYGMMIRQGNVMHIWGTEATKDVSKGIPYHFEKSDDGGKTWAAAEIPKVDYLLGMSLENEVILLSGISIPKGGIGAGKNWFELVPTMFISKDGSTFLELTGFSMMDLAKQAVAVKSTAPNGKYKAFISVQRGMDYKSYPVKFVRSQDEIPEKILTLREKCEIVWSLNSEILGLKKDGRFVAFYDVKSDKVEEVPDISRREKDKNNKNAALDFDRGVRDLLKQNK